MRLALLKEIPEDEGLRLQWNGLLEHTDHPQVFYTYEWALAVQRAYRMSLHPLLFLAYDSQALLTGVVALATNLPRDTASFLCATTGDYCDFISSPAVRSAFVAEVLSQLKTENIRSLTLTNLPADSATLAAIRQSAPHYGYHLFVRRAYVCAQMSMESLNRRNAEEANIRNNGLFRKTPGLPRKKMVRRSLTAMGREGPVRLDHVRSYDAARRVLPQFMQAHVARFLVTGRISNLAREGRRIFLTELAELLSTVGWLCVTRMMTGDRTVAWNFGFQSHGTWFWYQPTFDSELEKYSPGFCLLTKIIEEASENPEFRIVDLGLGVEEYKDRVANQSRETLYVTMRTSTIAHAAEIVRHFAARLAKASPRAEKVIRSYAERAKALRRRMKEIGTLKTLGWACHRVGTSILARNEVFFYELITERRLSEAGGLCLTPIDLNLLAGAAMQYENDEGTLAYLLRSAKRLRTKDHFGFALLNTCGEPVHFTWVSPFSGFHVAELNSTVPTPSEDSVILFDSWTPVTLRARRYYALTVGLVAAKMQRQGKRAWIFSAATNTSSVRGLEKMGFQRRFSIIRYKLLWWQQLRQENTMRETGAEMRAAS